jgi:peptidoglycan/LPS O-acetylase OafA/YrhL
MALLGSVNINHNLSAGREIALRELMRAPFKLTVYTSNVVDLARAVAAGLVVLLHARIYTIGDAEGVLGSVVYAFTYGGTQAVFWFFVISGYLVGGSVLSGIAENRFSFRSYFSARFSRLYIVLVPAFLLTYALDSWRHAFVGINAHAGVESAASLTLPTILGNLLFLETLFVPTLGSNYALWSLANEFWYYVTFPLLLAPLMMNKSRRARAALFILGLVILGVLARISISLVWLFVPWCMGAALRVCRYSPIKSMPLAWLLAIAMVLIFPYIHPVVGPVATLLVATTFSAVILASHGKADVVPWKSARVIKAFAEFSFSLYVVHLALMHLLATVPAGNADPIRQIPQFSLEAAGSMVILVGTSYCAAFLLAQLTERHTSWLRARLLVALGPLRISEVATPAKTAKIA